MKDEQRPPLDHDNCTFAVSVDWDAAQITLEGPPAGPGGGASLTSVPGVDCRSSNSGQGTPVPGGGRGGEPVRPMVVPGEPAFAYLGTRRPGSRGSAAGALRHGPARTPRPHSTAIAALSRLARLDSARRTTPVPRSPLWALEAADLARQCQRPSTLAHAAPSFPSAPAAPPCPATAPASKNLSGWLDPALVPPGVFRYGLSPDSDLDIRVHDDEEALITVEAMLAPGVGRSALASCEVRLVDSDARRVLAVSPLRTGGLRARAELPAPARGGPPMGRGGRRRGARCVAPRLRRMRRALRWADAALRAASRPVGLDPDRTDEQWAGLAALAWHRCRADWAAAGTSAGPPRRPGWPGIRSGGPFPTSPRRHAIRPRPGSPTPAPRPRRPPSGCPARRRARRSWWRRGRPRAAPRR